MRTIFTKKEKVVESKITVCCDEDKFYEMQKRFNNWQDVKKDFVNYEVEITIKDEEKKIIVDAVQYALAGFDYDFDYCLILN
jgi:hypothetical protein